MLASFPFTSFVLALALLVYVWVLLRVGAARAKHGVKAPSTDGPPEFLRVFRVHMNTLEQLVLFVPSLALFAAAWGDAAAAVVGIFWPVGRIVYALGYYQAPEKRSIGFGIAFVPTAVLLLGGLAGAIIAIF